MNLARELLEWAQALDPAAAFLFTLPFVVAAAGLLQHWLESRDRESKGDSPSPVPKTGH